MTVKKAESTVLEAGKSVDVFWKYMEGQTVSMDENGETIIPDCDVDRFIRGSVIWD